MWHVCHCIYTHMITGAVFALYRVFCFPFYILKLNWCLFYAHCTVKLFIFYNQSLPPNLVRFYTTLVRQVSVAAQRIHVVLSVCHYIAKLLFRQSVRCTVTTQWRSGLYILPTCRPEVDDFWFGPVTFQTYKPGWLVRVLSHCDSIARPVNLVRAGNFYLLPARLTD